MSSSQRDNLFTIRFGNLEPVVVTVVAQILTWRRVLLQMTKKDGQLSLDERQGSQNRLKCHHSFVERDKARKRVLDMQEARRGRRQTRGKKFSPLTSLSRSRLFLSHWKNSSQWDFSRVTINMTSCYEIEDEEEGDEDKLEKSSENEERALTIPKALPACMDWKQIFSLPEEIR